jgi:hypothetical protein
MISMSTFCSMVDMSFRIRFLQITDIEAYLVLGLSPPICFDYSSSDKGKMVELMDSANKVSITS